VATTQKQRDEIYRLRFEEEKTWAEIAPFFPEIPRDSLRRIGHREAQKRGVDPASVAKSAPGPDACPPPPKEKLTISHNEDGTVTAESRSKTIKTLEQLIEVAEIDLDKWQVVSWIANVWQQAQKNPDNPDRPIMVNLHQVKASLRPIHTAEAISRIDDMREELRQFAPVYPKIRRPKDQAGDGHLLELAINDLHYGKLSWPGETGARYDMETAGRLFREAAGGLVERARFAQIERILLVLGQDLFHVNSDLNATKRGTRQDVSGQSRQHFRQVRQMVREVVDELVQTAPVTLRFIPGNHDEDPTFYLGEALYDWYYHADDVEVVNDARKRQYMLYGANLLGFTHGHREKGQRLAQLMPVEVPELWAKSKFREFHCGHLHIKRETRYLPVNEFGGVRVRVLPSLCEADAWHFDAGYVGGVRAAQAFLWHERDGLTAELSWYPK
jgi:hypothetical protein